MWIHHANQLSDSESNKLEQISEILKACDSQIQNLIREHRANSQRWMPHEFLPWGEGRDFVKEPWSPAQSPLSPSLALAFETNLLTEDNLPFYHEQIARIVDPGSSLAEWNRIWTSEEGLHSIALRDYAYLMRVLDPVELEKNRIAIMRTGFQRVFRDPLEIFAYTTFQELATRVSHTKLGQKAQEPVLLKLMSLISRDENFHFIFYRAIGKMVLEIAPDLMLPAIENQLYTFEMPGAGLSDFKERHETAENLGIYGALEHRDLVIKPVLQFWGLEKLQNLKPESERSRDRILKILKIMDRLVERQQPREVFGL